MQAFLVSMCATAMRYIYCICWIPRFVGNFQPASCKITQTKFIRNIHAICTYVCARELDFIFYVYFLLLFPHRSWMCGVMLPHINHCNRSNTWNKNHRPQIEIGCISVECFSFFSLSFSLLLKSTDLLICSSLIISYSAVQDCSSNAILSMVDFLVSRKSYVTLLKTFLSIWICIALHIDGSF